MRVIEWVGQNGLYSNPQIERALAFGLLPAWKLKVLRIAARKRHYRVNQRVIRELRPDSPAGLSRFYRFGPTIDSYEQIVSDSDARIILNDPYTKGQFYDVTGMEPLGPAGTARHQTIVAPDGAALVQVEKTELFKSVAEMTRATASPR